MKALHYAREFNLVGVTLLIVLHKWLRVACALDANSDLPSVHVHNSLSSMSCQALLCPQRPH